MKKGLGRISIWNKTKGPDPASKVLMAKTSNHLDNFRTLWVVVNELDKPSAKVFDKIIKSKWLE